MVFDLKCKVSIDYGDGKDFTAATIIFKNDEGKHIILSSITDTTAVGEEIIKELSNMGKLAAKNSHQSNKKKIRDVTFGELEEYVKKNCRYSNGRFNVQILGYNASSLECICGLPTNDARSIILQGDSDKVLEEEIEVEENE